MVNAYDGGAGGVREKVGEDVVGSIRESATEEKGSSMPVLVGDDGEGETGKHSGLSETSQCPKCGTKTLEREGTDLHCWLCGHIVYYVFEVVGD